LFVLENTCIWGDRKGNECNERRKEGKAEFWTFTCIPQDSEIFSVLVLATISKNGYETFV